MRSYFVAGLFTVWGCLAQPSAPLVSQDLTVPPGTHIVLGLTSPVWAKSVQLGEPVYAETTFPVALDGAMAIPPGTYVRGAIDILFRPGTRSGRAEFRMSFPQMIFANGYMVALADANATVNVQVSPASDVLLDNGSQFEMVLGQPLVLNLANIQAAARMSRAPKTWQWKPATLCRPVPATPGTTGTYIPGTPGTPSTVIPGGPGMPATVIPGTPGTPSTYLAGTSGSPGIACPGPPAVSPTPASHKEPLVLEHAVVAAGQTLPAGRYEVAWEGLGPSTVLKILKRGGQAIGLEATVTALGKDALANHAALRANADGSFSLESVEFNGRNFGLRF